MQDSGMKHSALCQCDLAVCGFSSYTREDVSGDQAEFHVTVFDLAQPLCCGHWGNEPADGRFSLSL